MPEALREDQVDDLIAFWVAEKRKIGLHPMVTPEISKNAKMAIARVDGRNANGIYHAMNVYLGPSISGQEQTTGTVQTERTE